jgi:hypothetical protein
MRTEDEIKEQIDVAEDESMNGTKFPGMSYEDGIIEALNWVLEIYEDKPMDN